MTAQQASPSGPSAKARIWIRLIVAPIVLAVLLGVLWVHDSTGNELFSDVVLLLLGAAGAFEMARLFESTNRPVHVSWAALFGGLLAGVRLFEQSGLVAVGLVDLRIVLLTLALFVLMLAHLRDTRPRALESIAFTLIPILYVGLLLSWTGDLMAWQPAARVLVWVIITAKASDMAGWLVGRPFGRHKLIPSVSPGKSWEGLVGGLAGSVLCAVVLPGLLGIPQQDWRVPVLVLFGLLVGGASVLAGITWSGWKRRLGAKDSSTLLPEIGGVMDMIDSMLIAGPVALAFLYVATLL